MEDDCTELVERLGSFESRQDVVLSAIFAGWDEESECLTVRGELRSRSGDEIADTLSINAVAYDDRGRVVAADDRTITNDEFFEFQVFELRLSVTTKPTKVRLFPKKF